jgi:hypothetical protein
MQTKPYFLSYLFLAIIVGLITFYIGRSTAKGYNTSSLFNRNTDIRKASIQPNKQVFDLLEKTPTLKLKPNKKPLGDTLIRKLADKLDPRLSIYSILVNQSITVTPTAAWSDFIGTVSQGQILEFTGEPTFDLPVGYIELAGVAAGPLQNLESYAGICMQDVPAGQKYLIDFQVSSNYDGISIPQPNWVLEGNSEIVSQTTPISVSLSNTIQIQNVFFVVETAGDHFTFAEITAQAGNATTIAWTYEGATVTRIQ